MRLVRVIHTKSEAGAAMSLCLYELEDGTHVYGVERDGRVAMSGTKAEAKKFYGNRRW